MHHNNQFQQDLRENNTIMNMISPEQRVNMSLEVYINLKLSCYYPLFTFLFSITMSILQDIVKANKPTKNAKQDVPGASLPTSKKVRGKKAKGVKSEASAPNTARSAGSKKTKTIKRLKKEEAITLLHYLTPLHSFDPLSSFSFISFVY